MQVALSTRIEYDLAQRLEAYCAATGESKAAVTAAGIEMYIEQKKKKGEKK